LKYDNRSIGIDCLRAFAVLWVLCYHFKPLSIFSHGLYGVLLFFIISGYCIAFSIETSRSAWHFYAKRLGRLLPALVVCGFLTTTFKYFAPQLIEADRVSGWYNYLYTLFALPTLNFLRVDYFPPDGAYWSLQVEFQFYFACFLIIAIGLRQHLIPILGVLVLFRSLTTSLDQVSSNDFFPFFLAGLSIAAAVEGKLNDAIIGFVIAGIVDLYHLRLHFHEPSVPIESSRSLFLWIGTLMVYLAVRCEPVTLSMRRLLAPLAFVGLISYPLYLIHQDVGIMLLNALHLLSSQTFFARAFRLIALPAFFILVAAIIHYAVELPWIRPVTRFLSAPFGSATDTALQREPAVPGR
jgi:peptidoglycan/LPS O-acetylase OafA/YrhL